MFGINNLESYQMPYFTAKRVCLEALVQLLCNSFPAKNYA
jgi:hypothetical protein